MRIVSPQPRKMRPAIHRHGGLTLSSPLLAVLALLLVVSPAPRLAAAAKQPALTGRVVDDAGLLSAASQSALESKLKTLEDKSSIQLVVATVKSLEGGEIEPYANQLFRAWRLGQTTKNNGVLLLVAPNERKARIEVGYGLEGTLTDAISKLIITNAMIPRFKTGDFQDGVERGVDDIISVLSTDAGEWKQRPDLQAKQSQDSGGIPWWAIVLIVLFVVVVLYLQRKSRRGGMVFIPPIGSSTWTSGSGGTGSGNGSSSGDSGGGFSGGGGSSGGGGASGDW